MSRNLLESTKIKPNLIKSLSVDPLVVSIDLPSDKVIQDILDLILPKKTYMHTVNRGVNCRFVLPFFFKKYI